MCVTRIGAGDYGEGFADKSSPTNLEKQLEELKKLRPEELRKRWQALFGSTPPPRLRSSLMVQAIARRLQE